MGNNAADEAADFGRRRVDHAVVDAGRHFSGVCSRWYPVLLDLHRFLLPFLGMWLITMGVMARLLILWFGLLVPFPKGIGWYMLLGIMPCCLELRLLGLLGGSKFLHLLSVLRMLLISHTLSAFGSSGLLSWALFIGLLEVLILVLVVFLMSKCSFFMSFGLWAGESLSLIKRPILVIFVLGAQFQCRPFLLVQALMFGAPVVFIGAMMRSLCLLAGGLGRFVPCSIGVNHCRLRPFEWEKFGHGLTSRPRESALPVSGHAASVVTADLGCADGGEAEVARREVHWVSVSGRGRTRIRLNRKTPAHLVGSSVLQSRPRVWKRLRHLGAFSRFLC